MYSSWRMSQRSKLTRRLRCFQGKKPLVSWTRCAGLNGWNGAKRLNGWNDWNRALRLELRSRLRSCDSNVLPSLTESQSLATSTNTSHEHVLYISLVRDGRYR